MKTFQERFTAIDDGEEVNLLKNPNREALLDLADKYRDKLEAAVPGYRIELGGSLASDTSVAGKNDIDLRILLPEGEDKLEDMQLVSTEIADIVPFRDQRLIDGDQRALKYGLVHREQLNLEGVGEASVAVLIRPERDYVGYGVYQRSLPSELRAKYLTVKVNASGEEYELIKDDFYRQSRNAVARNVRGLLDSRFENVGNQELPIWNVMSRVTEHLKKNNKILVKSPTGSGKTTQIPQALHAEGFTKYGKIIVVQNRVVIAVETAKRVAKEMGVKIGTTIGYSTRHEKKFNQNTEILFVTSGVMRAMLKNNPSLSDTSVIFFDEFDERELSMDLVAALIEKAQEEGSEVKFIMTSATLNSGKLKRHFGDIPSIEAEGRAYPVEIHHENYDVSYRDLPNLAASKVEEIHNTRGPGHILIFMPGKGEINSTVKELTKKSIPELEIIPLHGSLEKKDRDKAFKASKKRKVIISTNIAERGVTIDGVAYVIDSGLARQKQYNPASDSSSLRLINCAQDAQIQRAGRAGRTQAGECFRLYSERTAKDQLRETQPEILRTPLREVVLQLKAMGYSRVGSPIRLLDAPSKRAWEEAKNQLRQLGALDPENEVNLSSFGEKLAKLPCDPRDGVMLLKAAEFGCVKEIAKIVGIRSARPMFIRPSDPTERREAQIAHAQLLRSHRSELSDLITMLNIYEEAEENGFSYNWCRSNYISWKALQEVRQNSLQFLGMLRKSKEKLTNKSRRLEAIAAAILSGMKDRIWNSELGQGYYIENPNSGRREYAYLGRESNVRVSQKLVAGDVFESSNGRRYLSQCTVVIDKNETADSFPESIENHGLGFQVEKMEDGSALVLVSENLLITAIEEAKSDKIVKLLEIDGKSFSDLLPKDFNFRFRCLTSRGSLDFESFTELKTQLTEFIESIVGKKSETLEDIRAKIQKLSKNISEMENEGLQLLMKQEELVDPDEVAAIDEQIVELERKMTELGKVIKKLETSLKS